MGNLTIPFLLQDLLAPPCFINILSNRKLGLVPTLHLTCKSPGQAYHSFARWNCLWV